MSYSESEILRLGRRKVQVRIFKFSDLRIAYILTLEFQKRDISFFYILFLDYQQVNPF